MRLFLIMLTSICLSKLSYAQTSEDSVKNTINNLFEGMKNAQADQVKNSFTDSAILQTIIRNKKGEVIVKNESVSDFSTSIASIDKGAADERIVFEVIRIDADLASVWTPYTFFYNGRFSHCGVNSFQLVRVNSKWKIQYLIDTRRKQNCNE